MLPEGHLNRCFNRSRNFNFNRLINELPEKREVDAKGLTRIRCRNQKARLEGGLLWSRASGDATGSSLATRPRKNAPTIRDRAVARRNARDRICAPPHKIKIVAAALGAAALSFPFNPKRFHAAFAPADSGRGGQLSLALPGGEPRSGEGGGAPPVHSNGKLTRGDLQNDATGERRTFDRYRLQRHAAKVLDWPKSLSGCEFARQRRGGVVAPIEVWQNSSADRGSWGRFTGLQTCGSVWSCPVCSNRRAWQRRAQLAQLIDWAKEEDFTLVMLTLTSKHDLETSLSEQRQMMKKAKSSLTGRAAFKNEFLEIMEGSVTATEVTHGKHTGWHLHFHYILVLDLRDLPAADRSKEAVKRGWSAFPAWELAAENAGLHVHKKGYAVDSSEMIAAYATNDKKMDGWTLADEATRGASKRSQGRHPFELLRLSCDENDEDARVLFIEYAGAIKGASALKWSKGLAERVGIKEEKEQGEGEGEQRDEVVRKRCGTLEESEFIGTENRKGVRRRRARMLVAVAKDGEAGFERERDNNMADPTAAELDGKAAAEAADDAVAEAGLMEPDPAAEQRIKELFERVRAKRKPKPVPKWVPRPEEADEPDSSGVMSLWAQAHAEIAAAELDKPTKRKSKKKRRTEKFFDPAILAQF